jgi:hypothetical protein
MANKKSRKVKARKASRTQMKKKTYRRKHRGGAYDPMAASLAQGRQYSELHSNQHGGGALVGAPVGDQGLLPDDLRVAARIAPLDARLGEISGMSDQSSIAPMKGGRRKSRRGGKKSRKALKKSRKGRKASKKSRKSSKKSRKRKMRGGAYSPAPYNAPTMLLSSSEAAKAGTADFSNPLLKH